MHKSDLSIPQLTTVIETRKRQLLDEQERTKKEQVRLTELILRDTEELQERLKAGETTKDSLRDILILSLYGLNHEWEGIYRKLQDTLWGKKGKLVLLSFYVKISHIDSMDPAEYCGAHYYRVGVLDGEKLILGQDTLPTLPVSRYAEEQVTTWGKDMLVSWVLDVKEGTLLDPFTRGSGYTVFSLTNILQRGGSWQSELIIGNEAVKKWLDTHFATGVFELAADAFSEPILEPVSEKA